MKEFLKSVWAVGWRLTVFLTVWGIFLGPLSVPIVGWLERHHLSDSILARLYLESCAAVTIFAAASIMLRFVDRRSLSTFGLTGPRSPHFFWSGFVLGAGIMSVAVACLWVLGIARLQAAPHFSATVLAMTGIAVFLNSLTQEILVQGYILQTIEAHGTSVLAVLMASGLFALLHAPAINGAWLPAINLYFAGVLLAIAYVLSRSLWLPIGVHFGWNFTQGPLLGLSVTGHNLRGDWRPVRLEGPAILTGGTLGLEGGVIATLVTLLGIAILLARHATKHRRESGAVEQ